jgi:hypothetical protein
VTEEISAQDAAAHTATGRRQSRRYWTIMVLGLLFVTAATCALYIPYLGNKLVFDDGSLFTSLTVFDYAQTPFSIYPRAFPYFTLGFTEVEFRSIEAHRIVSLILHLLNAFMMFRVAKVLLEHIDGISREKALWLALLGAALFALHPVAVYGAAYLVQRTIVLALLFSLLSIWFYLRALRLDRWTDCLTAALFYTLAIFSKEHAIMLPAAVVTLSPIIHASRRAYQNKALLYWAACLPAAVWIIFATRHLVGSTYEPFVSNTLSQMSSGMPLDTALGRWFVSAVTQMGLFFEYLRLWLLPDVHAMSIDMRIDFAGLWTPTLIALRMLAFLAGPAAALWLLLRRGRLGLLGAGLLFAWLMYLPELAAVRFQEPIVLYRSYLWAPAFLLMAIALLSLLNAKGLASAALVCLPVLFFLAIDRLGSFANEYTAWQDAAAKLARDDIPGADRIYYNRAHELVQLRRNEEALSDLRKVIAIAPPSSYNSYAQLLIGQAYYQSKDYEKAMAALERSLQLNSENGQAHFAYGLVLGHFGRKDDALREFTRSRDLGVVVAQLAIKKLQSASH